MKLYVKLLSGFPEVFNDTKKVHQLRMPIIVIITITIHLFTKSHANGLYDSTGFIAKQILPSSAQ